MSSEEHILVISPIGKLDVDRAFLGQLGEEIHRVFGYPTDIQPLLEEKDLWDGCSGVLTVGDFYGLCGGENTQIIFT